MPSFLHEGAIALVRENPAFIADLMRMVLHIEVPAFSEARLVEAWLNELIPAEYHADAVVLFSIAGRPAFGSILEAQLQEDERKRFTWPAYAVNARARHQCPFVLVAVTPDAETAQWAGKTIELGGGRPWTPFVVGPQGIPLVTDAQRARDAPEFAVLSVMAHGKGDVETAVSIALAATEALELVSDEQRMLYLALIESALGDAARKAFEMNAQVGRRISSWQRGTFEKGIAEGIAAGREEGIAAGREEGIAAGRASSVIDFLEARGLAVTEAQRQRVLSCTDPNQIDEWVRRAATIAEASALFA